jgi:superfamily II DNA or RNA helicase
LRGVCGFSNFGYVQYSTAALPDRVHVGLDVASRPPTVLFMEPELEITQISTPLEHLLRGGETSMPGTRAALARLEALWLLIEDRHRLLDAAEIEPLAHQASLVEHVLATPELRRVLIADEVGLGKTIEAGLIIRRLIEATPAIRPKVLYLTEARLVDNVHEEFVRMGLDPRRWAAGLQEARLEPGNSDPLVLASMHRAVYQQEGGVNNFDTLLRSGPWDVVIVDEAHHLTDWSGDGTDPAQRMKLVKKLVEKRLAPGGRVILLTGTPHQGHEGRFRSLLLLLSDSGKDQKQAEGRVIYRIKDDIRDWNGGPLFPIRKVNPPTLVAVGEAYQGWLAQISALLGSGGGSRAGAWRRAQALQWCASSPEAGLAYLVRMAIRGGATIQSLPALRRSLEALRPYRGGAENEPVEALEGRIRDGLEISEDLDDAGLPTRDKGLSDALETGVELVQKDAFGDKLQHLFQWMDDAPEEKFVVFAQPVETVYLLRQRLAQRYGAASAALIIGQQEPELRKRELNRFRRDPAVRALVSSRSGGEGINLQISRRLIHFDVPWNPMEMEQRVGRVHRYGGLKTVIVDTLVLKDSREQRVLDRCRGRLGMIVRDLRGPGGPEFESLFSRTMALIPIQEIEKLMAGEGFGPLTSDEEQRLDELVRSGYDSWKKTDEVFRARAHEVQSIERGAVNEADFEAFMIRCLGAVPVSGWRRRSLGSETPGEAPPVIERDTKILRIPDGSLGYIGNDGGAVMVGPAGAHESPRRLGMNDTWIANEIRTLIGGGDLGGKGDDLLVRGSGYLQIPREEWRSFAARVELSPQLHERMLVVAYVVRHVDLRVPPARETGSTLRIYCCSVSGEAGKELSTAESAGLMRILVQGRASRSRAVECNGEVLLEQEAHRIKGLRASKPGDPANVVFPVAAFWLEPDVGVPSPPR